MPVARTVSSETPLDSILVHPPTDISEALRTELFALNKVPAWVSAAVTRRDGLVIEHTFGRGHEANVLCAMAAAIVGSARSTGEALDQGVFSHSLVQYKDGLLLVMEAGPEAILACLFARRANLGLALMKVSQIARRIEERLAAL